jgi:predicted alpha/beta superfamily hydrolase
MVHTWELTIPKLSGDKTRRGYVWLPEDYAKFPKRRYPVLYMFDGHNVFFDSHATYGKSWGMAEYLKKSKKQLIVVAVECNHQGNGRLQEYSPFDFDNDTVGSISSRGREYMDWLVKELKPEIDKQLRTLPDREHTILCGSSMGGLMALYGATVYNRYFQRAASLSPSLWVAPDKVMEMVATASIRNDTCIYMDYGSMEIYNHAPTANILIAVSQLLLTKRVNLAFRIVPGGTHSEASWEQQIPIFMQCLGL